MNSTTDKKSGQKAIMERATRSKAVGLLEVGTEIESGGRRVHCCRGGAGSGCAGKVAKAALARVQCGHAWGGVAVPSRQVLTLHCPREVLLDKRCSAPQDPKCWTLVRCTSGSSPR